VQILRNVKTMSDMPGGEYDQEVHTFGIAGLGQSLPCDEANQNGGGLYMQNRLIITHESGLEDGDTTVGGGSSTPPVGGPAIGSAEWLRQLVADVVKGVIEAQKATSTTKTCPPVYTGVGGYSGNANAVQTWLLGNGYRRVPCYWRVHRHWLLGRCFSKCLHCGYDRM
jgi:hypothetical protein